MIVNGELKPEIEQICTGLNELGIDAQLSETYEHVQDIGKGLVSRDPSLGLINIKDGPIRWINFRKGNSQVGYGYGTNDHMDYGVPLTIESKITKEWIFAEEVKRFPIFGPVVRIQWKGGGWGRKVTDQLNGDPLMGQLTVMDGGIELTCYPEHACWIISAQGWVIPSKEQWDAYEALAGHLVTATQSHMQTHPPAF